MNRFHRQQDLVDMDRLADLPIVVVGCGAVGSFVTLSLAKMGCTKITVYDDDNVDTHNLPNQFFKQADVGRPKVDALADIVEAFDGVAIDPRCERFTEQDVEGVVICSVDTMDARQAIWKNIRFNPRVCLYIDTRMGAEVAVVHAINPLDPDDVRLYEDSLHGSDTAFQARCTERAIIYTVLGLAAITAGKVKKHVMGQPFGKTIVRDFKLSALMARA